MTFSPFIMVLNVMTLFKGENLAQDELFDDNKLVLIMMMLRLNSSIKKFK